MSASVANLSDARYFAAREVAWVGFCLDPFGDHYLPPAKVKEMAQWLEGPRIFASFGAQSPTEIMDAVAQLGLEAVSLGLFHDRAALLQLSPVPVFVEIVAENAGSLSEISQRCAELEGLAEGFIIDFSKNAVPWEKLLEQHTWGSLQVLCQQYPIWIAADVSPQQVPHLINGLSPKGIVLRGGEEEKVGVKSFEELDEVFDALSAM